MDRSILQKDIQNISQVNEMNMSTLDEHEILSEMSHSLDAGQFEVWYQPQYNHETGALIGAEALSRWKHPVKGIIMPDIFIPVFEKCGFIYEFDKFVWKQSCIFLREQLDQKQNPVSISVNISPYDIEQEDFADYINKLVDKYELSPADFRLEITESAFGKSNKRIIEVVNNLKEKGYIIEIDDFGSGYASLNTLKDVPADVLKLDMRFIKGESDSDKGGSIIASVVRMAKWIGLSVIAEGVETVQQANFLKSIGCCYIQGFLYSKPITKEEYGQLLKKSFLEKSMIIMEKVETYDVDTFWNPNSMDTLVFNTFVGGACIFEYQKGNITTLRVNEKYAQIFGKGKISVSQIMNIMLIDCVNEEDYQKLQRCIKKAISTMEEAMEEIVILDRYALDEKIYIRTIMRVIAKNNDRYLFYCLVEDISAWQQAKQKQRAAELKEIESSKLIQDIIQNINGSVTATKFINEKLEFVLVNKQFYDMLCCTEEQFETEYDDMFSAIHPDDCEKVRKIYQDLSDNRNKCTIEYRIITRTQDTRWIQSNISVIRVFGIEEPVSLTVSHDITDEKEINEKLRFINTTTHDILGQPNGKVAMENTLHHIMNYYSCDRSYIVEFDLQQKVLDKTYEICTSGFSSTKEKIQRLPFSNVEDLRSKLSQNQLVQLYIEDNEEKNGVIAKTKDYFFSEGTKEVILAPYFSNGELFGFVGIENPKLSTNRLGWLITISDYVAVTLAHRNVERVRRQDVNAIRMLMSDTPGGFLRTRVYVDGTAEIDFANEGFLALTQMTELELMNQYAKSPQNLYIYDNDEEVTYSRDATDGDQYNRKCQLKKKDGSSVWVMIYGRYIKTELGELYLNAYYTDITKQLEVEQKQRELLDNLPCGAGLFAYDHGNISIIHVNKKFWKLINQNIIDFTHSSIKDYYKPSDLDILYQEIESAIRQRRDAECDIRLKCGENTFKPFHFSAFISERTDGTYTLYASYTPIDDTVISFQEMFPIALSTMMEASEELSYVKDKDLRYICCSTSQSQAIGLNNPNDIMGKTDFDLYNKKQAEKCMETDLNVLTSGKAILNISESFYEKNGNIRLLNTSKYPIRDGSNNVIGIYTVSSDVTESKEKESQLQLLTSSIPGGLSAFTLKDGELTPLFFNDGYFTFAGYNREEYIKMTENDPLALVLDEDKPYVYELLQKIITELVVDKVEGCEFRCKTKTGSYRWLDLKCRLTKISEEQYILNMVQLDVTEHKEIEENLRQLEEEYKLAAMHSGRSIGRYNIADQTLTIMPDDVNRLSKSNVIQDVPYGRVSIGNISADTLNAYISFYEKIQHGETEGTVMYKILIHDNWHWLSAHFTTIFSKNGQPISGLISFIDVTDQYEKDAIFRRWKQSLNDRSDNSYTLIHCNLDKVTNIEIEDGSLLSFDFNNLTNKTFDEFIDAYAKECIIQIDRHNFIHSLKEEKLKKAFAEGKRKFTFEYREILSTVKNRWIRLSVDLIERPDATGIMAYLMFENIDESKRAELTTQTLAETDALTGLLNRKAFTDRMNVRIKECTENSLFAFFILDLDGFKDVNDTLGHAAGDQTLIDVGNVLRSSLNNGDLVGRLGGDEFVICLCNVPSKAIISKKARRIWQLLHRDIQEQVKISASMGITICPDNGKDFDILYHKADKALYQIKKSGKDNYGFYCET